MYIAKNCRGVMLSVIHEKEYENGSRSLYAELNDADLILADGRSELLKGRIPDQLAPRIVVLTVENDSERMVDENGIRYVYKFGSAPSLISSIAELADSYGIQKLRRRSSGKLKIIAVTGFCGGTGRTALSYVLGRLNQSEKKKNTLLFSAGRYSDVREYFRPQTSGISDINLLLLNFLSGFKIVPSRFLVQDTSGLCTFEYPSASSCDIPDLSKSEFKSFTELIETWDMFDTAVIDVGGAEEGIHQAVLEISDMVCVMHGGMRRQLKTEMIWMDRVARTCDQKNIVHIFNDHIKDGHEGPVVQNEGIILNHSSEYEIPDDPESFTYENEGPEISMTGRFAGAVSRVLNESEIII